ncbi:glycoside hydrolase family 16 protein [Novosphingobium humi]|uniref:glycoside hydrolase family 16 protein n=1 Tax=Novosphingobium humi TaxID=2282397 RepID=UPI0025B2240D|nr:glycoside hydrolase family 16 protein [Novosphingobium humi]WJS99338.1 glycoside hydrolase family 16 protein [Novosphingobium humi]
MKRNWQQPLVRGALILTAAAFLGGCQDLYARMVGDKQLNRSGLVQTFNEDFSAPPSFWDAVNNPDGRWKTNFYFGIQDVSDPRGWESRTLQPNGEQEYYGEPKGATNPFEWSKGTLTIVARPSPVADDPHTNHLPYLSGLITTEKSFNQRYGLFEARLALPMTHAVWPAFWLLPQPRMVKGWAQAIGQQEIDIFESIGEPDKLYFTHFSDDGGRKVADDVGREYYTNTDLTQFHTYSVLVSPATITWYFDDRKVRQRPNRDFHMPAYMLLNLAVGGKWPGYVNATTQFPAKMRIAWVRAYKLK